MNLENIHQRGAGLLVDVTRNGKRRRVACDTLEEAMVLKTKMTKMILVPDESKEQWSIGEAYAQCKEHVWKGKANESNATYNAKCAVDFFGKETLLDDITPEWAQGYIARLKQLGNTGGTINRKRAAFSKLCSFAVDMRKCKYKLKLQRQEENMQDIRFLTQEEEQRALTFLSQWGKDDHAEVVCVLIDTGLREGELWKLEEKDVDFAGGLITIRKPKNKETRYVPMVTRVREILARRIECTVKGEKLFPFTNDWLTRVWARLKFSMDLTDDPLFTPYALRKTCASRLVQRGVPLLVVKEWLGHKTVQVTMRYAKLVPKNLLDAAKVLEAC